MGRQYHSVAFRLRRSRHALSGSGVTDRTMTSGGKVLAWLLALCVGGPLNRNF